MQWLEDRLEETDERLIKMDKKLARISVQVSSCAHTLEQLLQMVGRLGFEPRGAPAQGRSAQG